MRHVAPLGLATSFRCTSLFRHCCVRLQHVMSVTQVHGAVKIEKIADSKSLARQLLPFTKLSPSKERQRSLPKHRFVSCGAIAL